MQQELHIVEEDTHLFWGLIILVCTAAGTYLLAGSFISMHWELTNTRQITALLLFLVSFIGIFKLSDPLYQFTFRFDEDTLIIDIRKGNIKVDTHKLASNEIEALRFSPDRPRSSREALFDFSRTYHLMWRPKNSTRFQKLLGIESSNIILKVDDIANIMRFIKRRVPDVRIPDEQARYFNL